MYYNSGKEDRIAVFEDTRKLCKTNEKLKKAIAASNEGQELITEKDAVGNERTGVRFEEAAKVIVSKKRSLEAAGYYSDGKVCVHNFASATNPGGGVTNGSSAQEESICRCSTLYFELSTKDMMKGFYYRHRDMLNNGTMNALYNDDCIFTPDVTVFKTDEKEPRLLSEDRWKNIDVITCAAPNLRERPGNMMNPHGGSTGVKLSDAGLQALHEKRMRRILDIARAHGEEIMILGAFGCGAFCNSPEAVARAMKKVTDEYAHEFRVIEFAVYCSPKDSSNYDVFRRILS